MTRHDGESSRKRVIVRGLKAGLFSDKGFERFAGDEVPCAATRAIEPKRVVAGKKPIGILFHGRTENLEDLSLAAAAKPGVLPLFDRRERFVCRQVHEGLVVSALKPAQVAVRVGGEQHVSISADMDVAGHALLTLFVVSVRDFKRIAGRKGDGTSVRGCPIADDIGVEYALVGFADILGEDSPGHRRGIVVAGEEEIDQGVLEIDRPRRHLISRP